jgi:putative endonuclease
MKQYYVYIMTNQSKTLYVGITHNLTRRVHQHKSGAIPGFTQKYKIKKLVYFEVTTDIQEALKREKQLKGWLRSKKIALIETLNPQWKNLSDDF